MTASNASDEVDPSVLTKLLDERWRPLSRGNFAKAAPHIEGYRRFAAEHAPTARVINRWASDEAASAAAVLRIAHGSRHKPSDDDGLRALGWNLLLTVQDACLHPSDLPTVCHMVAEGDSRAHCLWSEEEACDYFRTKYLAAVHEGLMAALDQAAAPWSPTMSETEPTPRLAAVRRQLHAQWDAVRRTRPAALVAPMRALQRYVASTAELASWATELDEEVLPFEPESLLVYSTERRPAFETDAVAAAFAWRLLDLLLERESVSGPRGGLLMAMHLVGDWPLHHVTGATDRDFADYVFDTYLRILPLYLAERLPHGHGLQTQDNTFSTTAPVNVRSGARSRPELKRHFAAGKKANVVAAIRLITEVPAARAANWTNDAGDWVVSRLAEELLEGTDYFVDKRPGRSTLERHISAALKAGQLPSPPELDEIADSPIQPKSPSHDSS